MSRYLTLIPIPGGSVVLQETDVYQRNQLSLDQDHRILDQLYDLATNKRFPETNPIPPQLWLNFNGEEGCVRTRKDAYGTALTFIYAEDLRKLQVPDDTWQVNKAIFAYIAVLPPDTVIVLYWH